MVMVSLTLGCLFTDDSGNNNTRSGFDRESILDTAPQLLEYIEIKIDPPPIINTTKHKSMVGLINIGWYIEKNTIYCKFGGTLNFTIKNNSTERIYINRIGIIPSWHKGWDENDSDIFSDVGKYVDPGQDQEICILSFPGPTQTGKYEYQTSVSVYSQNETGLWNDCGIQKSDIKTMTVVALPKESNYKIHKNLPQYYDKINGIVDPTADSIYNLSREISRDFSGPFNIYQVCAIFDFVKTNVKYFSDPSSTANDWCTPEQTLFYGGDCEDHSTLLASLYISLGGTVRMFMTDSHAFLGLYIGDNGHVDEIVKGIRKYYRTNVNVFWFEDDLGLWLLIDTIGSFYPGGLPLGAGPIATSSSEYGWSWNFTETENLFITDIIPKK